MLYIKLHKFCRAFFFALTLLSVIGTWEATFIFAIYELTLALIIIFLLNNLNRLMY